LSQRRATDGDPSRDPPHRADDLHLKLDEVRIAAVGKAPDAERGLDRIVLAQRFGAESLGASPDLIRRAAAERVDGPLSVVPGAEEVELALDRDEPPREEGDALPEAEGAEEALRLAIELAGPPVAFDYGDRFERAPEPASELAAVVGDEEAGERMWRSRPLTPEALRRLSALSRSGERARRRGRLRHTGLLIPRSLRSRRPSPHMARRFTPRLRTRQAWSLRPRTEAGRMPALQLGGRQDACPTDSLKMDSTGCILKHGRSRT
jgi:hypothetical protein